MNPERRTLAVQIALTVTALEFFGPVLRDAGASHALNPTWVGHARVHLVWLLGFMFLSGVVNLYLIWRRRELVLSALWQSCNLGGFWIAYFLSPAYEGAITVPGVHTQVFGIDENVFVFSVLSLVMAGIWLALARGSGELHAGA
ncbi:MAG: hypothetical protein ACR2P8_11570 [Myxococcota bacterium]